MALVGGGGAGNVAGSNPAGTGTTLNYIGNHAYAYSGAHAASTTLGTHLNFTTGNEYILGRIYLNGSTENGSGSGEVTTADIIFNGETVARLKVDSAVNNDGMATSTFNDLLIPSFTHVEVKVDSSATNSGRFTTVTYTGRIYA